MKINTERIDSEVSEQQKKADEMKTSRDIFVDSANKYLALLEPILKKRKIEIAKTQMYFNTMPTRSAALVHIDFKEVYGEYNGVKAKNLEKEIRGAKIPCPINNFNRGVTITLYEETLYENRFKEE